MRLRRRRRNSRAFFASRRVTTGDSSALPASNCGAKPMHEAVAVIASSELVAFVVAPLMMLR